MIGHKKTIFVWTVPFDSLWNNSEEEYNGYSHRIWGHDTSGMNGCLGGPLPGRRQVRPQVAWPWPWPCLPSAECQRPRRGGRSSHGGTNRTGRWPCPRGVTSPGLRAQPSAPHLLSADLSDGQGVRRRALWTLGWATARAAGAGTQRQPRPICINPGPSGSRSRVPNRKDHAAERHQAACPWPWASLCPLSSAQSRSSHTADSQQHREPSGWFVSFPLSSSRGHRGSAAMGQLQSQGSLLTSLSTWVVFWDCSSQALPIGQLQKQGRFISSQLRVVGSLRCLPAGFRGALREASSLSQPGGSWLSLGSLC